MSTPPDYPLSGIRVLDLTTTFFGPYTTRILGDFGADVIKIEAPGGDTLRGVGPSRNEGMAALFMAANRNKRSIVLDLKKASARKALWRLIEGADVFAHNMRPQKISALGFDPDAVLVRNPGIVYGGLHGYFEEGPYGGRPAYDDVVQGQSGLAGSFAVRDGEPALVPAPLVDKTAAVMASNALMAAIINKIRTGQGSYVEVGMFESMVAFNLLEHQYGAMFVPPEGEMGYPRTLSPERRPFPTRDGHICILAYTDKQWRTFWELAGEPERCDDPRFATIEARTNNIDPLYTAVGQVLRRHATDEWLELLSKAEIPAGPVNSFEDVRSDPHLKSIGFFQPFQHPSEGQMEMLDTGYRINRQSLPVRQHPPLLGEHGQEILAEAGYSETEIQEILEGK